VLQRCGELERLGLKRVPLALDDNRNNNQDAMTTTLSLSLSMTGGVRVFALAQFASRRGAEQAARELDGRCMYDDCNRLAVRRMQLDAFCLDAYADGLVFDRADPAILVKRPLADGPGHSGSRSGGGGGNGGGNLGAQRERGEPHASSTTSSSNAHSARPEERD